MSETFWIALAGLGTTAVGTLLATWIQIRAFDRRADAERKHQMTLRQGDQLQYVTTDYLNDVAEFVSMCSKALTMFRHPYTSLSEDEHAELLDFRRDLDIAKTTAVISVSAARMGDAIQQLILTITEKLTDAAGFQTKGQDIPEDDYGDVIQSLAKLKSAYMNAKAGTTEGE